MDPTSTLAAHLAAWTKAPDRDEAAFYATFRTGGMAPLDEIRSRLQDFASMIATLPGMVRIVFRREA